MGGLELSTRRTLLRVALPCFVAGVVLMQAFAHREALLDLTLESYQVRQKAMTSTLAGPDRYYVLHRPGVLLADATAADPAVLAIEGTALNGLTGIDIAPGNPASVAAIRALDGVHYAIRSNIPLFCH